jgi:hypothetical protein
MGETKATGPEQARSNGFEVIDAKELAVRLRLPVSWVRNRSTEKTPKGERIPHARFGRWVRFFWGSPELETWLKARRQQCQ